MQTTKRLTIGRARNLIKRELGLSGANLTAPPEMNGNRNYPWYEMLSGSQKIEVYTTSDDHFSRCEMVALSVTHGNSSYGVTEYFYSDTMEYASEYTEMKQREDIAQYALGKMYYNGISTNTNLAKAAT